jgi:O-antigen/teichoic acid export membrane protein/transcriptional regulator with XRE-family HTH domain
MWRNLIKANTAYALGSISNGIALVLLVPILVNTLTSREYGAWAIYEVSIYILITFFSLGLEVGLMREYWHLDTPESRRRLISTILIAALVWGGIFYAIGLFIVNIVAAGSILGNSSSAAMWVPTIAWTESVLLILLSVFRIRQQAIAYALLSIGRMMLFMSGAIAFVMLDYGVDGALAGRFLGGIVALVAALFLLRKQLGLYLDRVMLRQAVRYGLPLFPYNVASYVLLASDRYMLEYFATLEIVALYAFAYKVATALDVIVIRPFNTDWAARRFQIATRDDAGVQYARVQVLFPLVAVGFSLLLLSGTPVIYHLVAPPEYLAGMSVVPLILLAFMLWGMEGPVNIGIMLKGHTQYMPLVGWIAAAVCLVLNFWWIPEYGMVGAAWSTIIAYGVHTLALHVLSQRFYPLRFPFFQFSLVVVAGLLGYGGITFLDSVSDLLVSTVLKVLWTMLIIGIAAALLWYLERYKPAVRVSWPILTILTIGVGGLIGFFVYWYWNDLVWIFAIAQGRLQVFEGVVSGLPALPIATLSGDGYIPWVTGASVLGITICVLFGLYMLFVHWTKALKMYHPSSPTSKAAQREAPIRQRIHTLRRKQELSYVELSQRTGLRLSTLMEIEYGKQPVPREHLDTLATALGTSASFLLSGKHNQQHISSDTQPQPRAMLLRSIARKYLPGIGLLVLLVWLVPSIQYRIELGPVSFALMEPVVLGISLILLIYQLIWRRRLFLSTNLLLWIAIGYLLLAAAVRPWSPILTAGLSDVRDWAIPLITTIVLLGAFRTRWRAWSLLIVYIAAILSIIGLYQVITDSFRPFVIEGAIFKTGFVLADDGLTLETSSYAAGFFSHPNRFAQYLFVGFCVAQGWLAGTWHRALLWKLAIIGLIGVTLYFTYAKASLVSMVITVGLFWLFFLLRNDRLLLAVLIFLGVSSGWLLLGLLLPIIPATFFETLQWRLNLWHLSLGLLGDNPSIFLFGNGTELLLQYLPEGISEPHNVYIYLTLKYGVSGLLLLVLTMIGLVYLGWRDRVLNQMHREPVLAGLWFALIGFLLVGLVESNLQEIEMRMLFLLVVGCYIGLSRELRHGDNEHARAMQRDRLQNPTVAARGA